MLREGLPLEKWRQFASRRTTISDIVSAEFIAVFVVVVVVNTGYYYSNSPEFCCKMPPVVRRGGYS